MQFAGQRVMTEVQDEWVVVVCDEWNLWAVERSIIWFRREGRAYRNERHLKERSKTPDKPYDLSR